MAALSRRLNSVLHQYSLRLPSSLGATVFYSRSQHSRNICYRYFSSAPVRAYKYPSNPTVRSFISSDPVLSAVSKTRKPILLYEAPKDKRWLYKTYGLGAACVGLGLWTLKFGSELPPEEFHFFVRPTYMVVGLTAIGIGLVAFKRPVNRITTLEVIPSTIGGPLQLRIRAKTAPFYKEQVILADIGEATLSEKTQPMVSELSDFAMFRKQRVSEGLGDMFIAQRAWEMSARWIYQRWAIFFNRFKHAVLQFGITQLHIGDHKWKIDCTGFLLENGKAIDRIISED